MTFLRYFFLVSLTISTPLLSSCSQSDQKEKNYKPKIDKYENDQAAKEVQEIINLAKEQGR